MLTPSGRMPMRNSEMPATMPPDAIHGVRRPKIERVRSDMLPTTRLEISEANAVAEFSTPKMASLLSGAISAKRCGSSTAATICNASIHANENTKNATQKRVLSILESSLACSAGRASVMLVSLSFFFKVNPLRFCRIFNDHANNRQERRCVEVNSHRLRQLSYILKI